jgi:tRNA (guanine37-N1)-methyltransferase
MRLAVVTLFPELFSPFLETSFVGRAMAGGQLSVHLEPLRAHGFGKHLSIDDTPYGGGSGMVMRVDCVMSALEAAERALAVRPRRILLTPQGRRFEQCVAHELKLREALLLVCGRYEGFDERIREFVDEELSLGDFVLTGGEVAAMAVIESVVRLLPGVLGNADSALEESFSDACGGLLEYPQYTRPASFRGVEVPEVLRSGDHAKIADWRRARALERTGLRRPDLLSSRDRSTSGSSGSR